MTQSHIKYVVVGGNVESGCVDTEGETGIPGNRAIGGDVEGFGGNFKLLAHSLHHLPQLPTQISGGSRHRYYHS